MLTEDEKELLKVILEKHLAFVTSNYRNSVGSQMNNIKKRQKMSETMAHIRNIQIKVEDM